MGIRFFTISDGWDSKASGRRWSKGLVCDNLVPGEDTRTWPLRTHASNPSLVGN